MRSLRARGPMGIALGNKGKIIKGISLPEKFLKKEKRRVGKDLLTVTEKRTDVKVGGFWRR